MISAEGQDTTTDDYPAVPGEVKGPVAALGYTGTSFHHPRKSTLPSDASESTAEAGRSRRGPRAAKPRDGASQSQSLGRGLTLLETLAAASGGLTLSDLANRVGLAPSTTHRLLGTLENQGFVQLDEILGQWFVGARAFVVGNGFLKHRDLSAQARPFMRQLMEDTGETVNLAVLDGDGAIFVSQVECREMMRMVATLGGRAPLHASGVGKALLAALPPRSLQQLLSRGPLPRITARTLTGESTLKEALTEIRRFGYAVDDEEHAVGLRCLAATVHDEYREPLGAISISGPRARMPGDGLADLGTRVSRTAAAITAALGGQLPDWWPTANRPKSPYDPDQVKLRR